MADLRGFSNNRRWAGLLPLVFFLGRAWYFAEHGGMSQILWMCHFTNLTLAIGILFDLPILIGISTYWLVMAVPFWLIDVFTFGLEGLTSAATHLGGMVIAVWAMFKAPTSKRMWHVALGYYLSLQLICWLFTPPELNINMAHGIYRGWEAVYPGYAIFWLVTTGGATLALLILDSLRLTWIRKRGTR